MTPDVEDKIAQTRQALQGRIDALREDISWGGDENEIRRRKRRLNTASNNLELFDRVTQNLPPEFELRIVEPKGDRQITDERAYFSPSLRRDFYKAILKDPENREKLMEMGMSPDHVRDLRITGNVPRNDNEYPLYDLSIEHIHDLQLGGESVYDNLCLLPSHINTLKSNFVRAQFLEHDKKRLPEELVTFGPALVDGEVPKVPVVPGGYRAPALKSQYHKRIDEFLGATSVLTRELVAV